VEQVPAVCTIPCRGDLLHKSYIVIALPRVTGRRIRWCTNVGLALIDRVTLTIGGQEVDSQTSDFMYIWNSLSLNRDEASNLFDVINAEDSWQCGYELEAQLLYVPLNLPFCGDAEDALPIGSLHDVQVTVHTHALETLLEGEVDAIHGTGAMALSCDFVTVGVDECQSFAAERHSYLIRQTQMNVFDHWRGEHDLRFEGECVELFVVCRPVFESVKSDRFNYSDRSGRNPVVRAVLTHDGDATELSGAYMNSVQPFQYHTGRAPAGVNTFSYALRPEDSQPSGSCNLSGVGVQRLHLDLTTDEEWSVTVYARTYALLTVSSGAVSVVTR
jgi:hypothetical protein